MYSERRCSSRSSRSTFSGHLDMQRRNFGHHASNSSSSSCSYSSPSSLTAVAVPRVERMASNTLAQSIGTTPARLRTDSKVFALSSSPPPLPLLARNSSVLLPQRLPIRGRRCPAQSRTPSGVLPSSILSACCSLASICRTMTNSCSSPLKGPPPPRHSSEFSTWRISPVSITSSM